MKNEGWIDVVEMRTDDMFKEQCKAFNRICDSLKWCRQYFSKIWSLIKKCFSKIWKKCISYLKYGLYGNKIIKEQCEKIEKQESKIRELEEKEKELNKIKEDMNSEKTLLNKQREKIKNDIQKYMTLYPKFDSQYHRLQNEAIKILKYFDFDKKIIEHDLRSIFTGDPIPYDRYHHLISASDYKDFENQIDTNTADDEFLDKIKKYSKDVYGKQ